MLEGIRRGHPILVVKYEDLKSDVLTQLKRMLEFLNVPYSDEELEKRLSEDYRGFHRLHKRDDFEHFTPEQRQFVLTGVQEMIFLLETQNDAKTHGIEEYLK